MKKISIMDTSIATKNIGDEIIMESVNENINRLFKKDMVFRFGTHQNLDKIAINLCNESEYVFVGGTNLLSPKTRLRNNQWNIDFISSYKLKNNIVLMGVGCNSYNSMNFLSKKMYKRILDSKFIHSVRDNYTVKLLQSIGVNNVVNTGCPTLWKLDSSHCKKIPSKKSRNVVCTFTDYNKNFEKDKYLANILFDNYEKVYCWIQGSKDYEYIKTISDRFIIVNPNLQSYDDLLESNIELDFVGTRLHAGIRAMQKNRRSIIISIDNRAREMGKDFNLNVLEREDIHTLESLVNSEFNTHLRLNWNDIKKWKEQFEC